VELKFFVFTDLSAKKSRSLGADALIAVNNLEGIGNLAPEALIKELNLTLPVISAGG
jgi:hypothetical protein